MWIVAFICFLQKAIHTISKPVKWRNDKALGRKAEGPGFDSTSALLSSKFVDWGQCVVTLSREANQSAY